MEQRCSDCLLILSCPDYPHMLRKHAHASGAHMAPVSWLSKASQKDSKPQPGRRRAPQALGPYVRCGEGSGVTTNILAMKDN